MWLGGQFDKNSYMGLESRDATKDVRIKEKNNVF